MEPALIDQLEGAIAKALKFGTNPNTPPLLQALAAAHATLVARDRLEAEKAGLISGGTVIQMLGPADGSEIDDVLAGRVPFIGEDDGETG